MIRAISLSDDVRSDAELVVELALEAIDGDRLDLAAALIVLARQLRHGDTAAPLITGRGARTVAVPLIGATREESPSPRAAGVGACCSPTPGSRTGFCGALLVRAGRGWQHADPEITDHDADPGAVAS